MNRWWDTAVMYQVYLRSFADSDGDGVGDLAGLTQRLDYIKGLEVQGMWLTPFQPSPQLDFGYDVADYTDVDPLFGTMDDYRRLIQEAHQRNLRVLIDIVPNHCSSAHPLFQQALRAAPGSPERSLFHFKTGPTSNQPPNNWQSVFGGGAWTRANPNSTIDLDWYLHLFSAGQPDWNWNHPDVITMFDDVLRFWFNEGADGIRIDVAHALYKAPGLPDAPDEVRVVDGLRFNNLASDQEVVHDVYRRWRKIADKYDPPRILVGEVNLEPERAARYARADELHQTFAFEFVSLTWDPQAWIRVGQALEQARLQHGAIPTWALENHDIVRSTTRYGGGDLGEQRARAALLGILGLPGGAYVYQGQEAGLPEANVAEHLRVDPMWHRGGVSRDGARIPLPWIRETDRNYGFSLQEGSPAWLPQPSDWGQYAVGNGRPTTALLRQAIQLRHDLHQSGTITPNDPVSWQATHSGGIRVRRSAEFEVLIAMGDDEPVDDDRVLICSEPVVKGVLPAGASAWIGVRAQM